MAAQDDGSFTPDIEHFRSVMDRNPMPTVITRMDDGVIVHTNAAYRRLLGYEDEELLGRSVVALDIWVDGDQRGVLLDRLRREGRVVGYQARVRGKGGTVFDVLASVEQVELHGEDCVVGVFHDITDRVRAEHEVERLNQQLLSILAAVGDGLFGLDTEGRCTFVNPAAVEILGYTAEELVGRVMHDVVHHSYADGSPYPVTECPASRTLTEGMRHRVADEVMWRRDGTALPVEYTSQPIFEDGAVTGAVVMFHDISERRRAEEMLVAAYAEAEQASRAKTEFLSRMSHELRTPLNAILGFGQLLELEDLGDDQQESVMQILHAGRHLLELINEVLDISRIESGRIHLSLEPVRLADPVGQALGMVQPLAAARDVHLPLALDGDADAHVRADRHRLEQVVLNLLANAVKYNRPGGEVRVAWRATGAVGTVQLVVEDTGIGIAAEDLDRIFLPFERVASGDPGVEGTGLGLTLSRRLVEAMGGTLSVRSEAGRGSTFVVELQRIEAFDRAEDDAPSRVPGAARPAARPTTILYVEDNLANVRLMERILVRRPGVTLLVAMQGSLGLDLARQHRPDLVLLDLNLPDMSGEEVLRRLRADPATEAVPVVVISGDATPGQAARLRRSGADDYLTKPFDVARLLEVIDATR